MLIVMLAGIITVSTTVLIHAVGTTSWIKRLRRKAQTSSKTKRSGLLVLIQTALVLIFLHVSEVLAWGLTYQIIKPEGLASFQEAVYFSFTTFTTLGYGDVVISGTHRLLTGIESLNGVLLIGWSTAVSFAVIERIWREPEDPRTV